MPENEGTFDMKSKAQICGVLLKKPLGHQSNKWSKRFFVLMDGFLLYYADNERKEVERRKYFNVHPKGVLPLGGCDVQPIEEPGHPFVICIKNDDFMGDIVLAAETEYEREKWINLLRLSGRITWSNLKLGEDMIRQLEHQGLQMSKEKQFYVDKLQNETMALHDEREKTGQLEQIRLELEKEKTKLETFMQELKEEADKIKLDMEEMVQDMRKIEDEKQDLQHKTHDLQTHLEELAKEKEKTLDSLKERDVLTRKLSVEKQTLSEDRDLLSKRLTAIETETNTILTEKAQAEKKLQENEEHRRLLEEERKNFSEHSLELQASIKDLIEQKKMTENELREEIIARLETEKRLQEAENSLHRLESKLNQTGTDYSQDDKDDMMGNVRKLKFFFESLAMEAEIDAEKPLLMQTTISARKTFVVRTKSKRFQEKRRKRIQSMKWSSSDDKLSTQANDPQQGSEEAPSVRRAVSLMGQEIKIPLMKKSSKKSTSTDV